MEDNSKTYGFIIFAIIVIAALFYFISSNSNKPVDWRKTYKASSKEPYGTYLLDKLLKNDYHFNYDGKKITRSQFDSLKRLDNHLSLFYLGKSFSLTEERADSLLGFVKNGGTVFIVAEEFDKKIIEHISGNWYTSAYYGDSVRVTGPRGHDSFDYIHVSDFDTIDYSWKTIKQEQIYYDHNVMSYLEGEANVISIKFGEHSGKLILCSTPILFTNYYLRNERQLMYAERIFSEIPKGEMIWSPFHWTSKDGGLNWSTDKRESPLQFIISNKYYRAAYITILVLFLLIIIFKSKRKQSIIPVTDRKENNAVVFVQNLSELYLLQRDNRKIVKHQKRIFINYVWDNYKLSLHNVDEKVINRLEALSQVDKSLIEEIIEKFRLHKEGQDFSNKMIIELDQELDKFYSGKS